MLRLPCARSPVSMRNKSVDARKSIPIVLPCYSWLLTNSPSSPTDPAEPRRLLSESDHETCPAYSTAWRRGLWSAAVALLTNEELKTHVAGGWCR